jgi:hypothetical protein
MLSWNAKMSAAAKIAASRQQIPQSATGRRRRIYRYQLTVGIIVVASIAISFAAAKLWPIQGLRIQGSFFLSLASSCLTLFGLVFTLCLIGTQFMVARTNVVVRRIFGPGTWLYLGLFVVAILWTLAISYRADNNHSPARICIAVFARRCFSEAQAGRASIFGVTWSLLLLLPFILYIYRRLTVTFAFSSITSSALRARTVQAFRRRCIRLSNEILALSSDDETVELGIAYLLEVGTVAVQRSRILRNCSAYSDAYEVTNQFCTLNKTLASRPALSSRIISNLQQWSTWLISKSEESKGRESSSRVITRDQVRAIARMAVDEATYILRMWQSSPGMSAQSSVHLIQEVATACKVYRVRMNFSLAALELAKCGTRKATEGPEIEFNLAIRGLISLVEITASAERVNLRGEVTVKALSSLLADLGNSSNDRVAIPSWVLNELHELTDTLSRRYPPSTRPLKGYLIALTRMHPTEMIAIIRGPLDSKQHLSMRYVHSSWQSIILKIVRESASEEVALKAQSAAIASWIKGDEFNETVGLFEELSTDYINGEGLHTSSLLSSTADDFRLGFQEHPIIKAELWRRRLRAEQRRQRRKLPS